jgi:hypothetical protein
MSLPNYGNVFPDDILGRIRDLEDAINQLTGGTYGKVTVAGDVTGLSDATTVERLQGSAVSSAAPSSGQVLEWDGSAWTPTAPDAVPDWNLFGDGVDGDVTVSTTVTLTQDKFYDDLTVTSAGVLKAGGYRIYVKGTLTVNSGGVISHDGLSATDRSGASGAAAGSNNGFSGNGGNGANGGNFSDGSNASGSSWTWGGGNGGAGGAGSTTAGGSGATSTAQTVARLRSTHSIMNAVSFQGTVGSFTGGGGGGGGGGPSGANGGGGGGGGGVLHISAHTLVNDGTIRAHGGNGANGNAGSNGGGGGGGGGGVVLLSYKTKSGSGTVTVSGGSGGNAAGTGSAGSAGSAGTIYELALV